MTLNKLLVAYYLSSMDDYRGALPLSNFQRNTAF